MINPAAQIAKAEYKAACAEYMAKAASYKLAAELAQGRFDDCTTLFAETCAAFAKWMTAQAGEAGTAETRSGSVHEHATPQSGDAP